MTVLRGSCLYGGVRFEIDGLEVMLALPLRTVPKAVWRYSGRGSAAPTFGFSVARSLFSLLSQRGARSVSLNLASSLD
jgi:hypothetical protein